MDLIDTKNLTMDPDTGLVWRKPADHEDEDHEYLGHIEDPDNCPWGMDAEWSHLLDRWQDSGRATRGYAAAVAFSYYDRLSTPRMN